VQNQDPQRDLPAKTNRLAIASLILGILGGILLSVTFGLVALRQIDRRDEKGRGLALAGLALSGFWVLVVVAFLVFAPSYPAPVRDPDLNRALQGRSLAPGDCLSGGVGSVMSMSVVPCTDPHAAEVYTVFTFPDDPYPGDAELVAEVEKRCGRSFAPYLTAATEDLEVRYLRPSSMSWALSRTVTCIAADPSGTRTGSLVNQPTPGPSGTR
jgi:hypothetical protein